MTTSKEGATEEKSTPGFVIRPAPLKALPDVLYARYWYNRCLRDDVKWTVDDEIGGDIGKVVLQ